MKKRIAELEAALKTHAAPGPAMESTPIKANPVQGQSPSETQVGGADNTAPSPSAPDFDSEKLSKSEPFAFADWAWLNGNPRTKDTPVAYNGSVGTAASYLCTNGSTSAVSSFSPSANGFTVDNIGGSVAASCFAQYGSGWSAWQPDLRKTQLISTIAIMVKF